MFLGLGNENHLVRVRKRLGGLPWCCEKYPVSSLDQMQCDAKMLKQCCRNINCQRLFNHYFIFDCTGCKPDRNWSEKQRCCSEARGELLHDSRPLMLFWNLYIFAEVMAFNEKMMPSMTQELCIIPYKKKKILRKVKSLNVRLLVWVHS